MKWPPEQEDLSGLMEASIAMHEWFMVLVQSGFTERQALIYIAEQTAAYAARNEEEDE